MQRRRYPRTGYEDVVELVNAAGPPTVLMRENRKTTDIVIRFSGSSRQLTKDHTRVFFENSVPLKRVFEDTISTALATGENTIRWELAAKAYRAYQMTWLRLFRVKWINQVYPESDPPKWFSDMEKIFKSPRPSGRPKKIDARQLRNRFNLLSNHARLLHGTIRDHLANKPVANRGYREDVIRTFWRDIQKIPGGILILGGEVFGTIPYGKQVEPATLANPTTWKPRQLAIALLAIEARRAYHTIERKFPEHKRNKVLRP